MPKIEKDEKLFKHKYLQINKLTLSHKGETYEREYFKSYG
jgi:hypothetical protein